MVDEDWRRMAIYYVQAASGAAKVRNLPGFQDPYVSIRQSAEDLATLTEGLGRLAEVLFAAGARRIFPSLAGYPILNSADDIRMLPQSLAPRDYNATSVHVFSSCPMGEDMTRCAADSFGRIPGADGLRIVDASLLCTPTVVNPQGTVMAIAHRNAKRAIEDGFR
jgi:choline dehydrogenase-like flavoprotein